MATKKEGNEPEIEDAPDGNDMVPAVLIFLMKKTPGLEFVLTTRSGFPSPSKSPKETMLGEPPTVKSIFGASEISLAKLSFCKTEMELAPPLAVTRSGLPSPSRSAAATCWGLAPTIKSSFAAKEIIPARLVFLNIEIALADPSETINSGLPSPFRSAMVTELGPVPVGRSILGRNEKVPGVL